MKLLFSILTCFFYSCSQAYTLIPCSEINYKMSFSKIATNKNAKIIIEADNIDNIDEISLISKEKKFELHKSLNTFLSNEKIPPDKYQINPKIKNVIKTIYVWDEDIIEAENSLEKKLAIISYGKTFNSVSKCMCDTDDWFKINAQSNCLKPIVRASVVSQFENEINFEIYESGQSFGLLNINHPYLIDISKENIIHVFSKKSDATYKYYIDIKEICYPKIEKIKVISFVNKAYNTTVLIDAGINYGIIKNMKFYFVDNDDRSLKTCSITDLSEDKSVCTFHDFKIKELPINVYFME